MGECDRGSEVVIVRCEVIMVVYFDTQSWPICCVQINRANLYKLPCVVEVNVNDDICLVLRKLSTQHLGQFIIV